MRASMRTWWAYASAGFWRVSDLAGGQLGSIPPASGALIGRMRLPRSPGYLTGVSDWNARGTRLRGIDPDQDAALHACGRHLAQHGEVRRARAQAPGARQLGAEHTTGGAQSDAVMVSGRLGDRPRPEVTQRETPTPPRGAA